MRPQDWFSVGARLIGLALLVFDAVPEYRYLVTIYSPWWPATSLHTSPNAIYVLHAAVSTIVGLYLLFRANHFTGFIYRKPAPPEK